MSSSTSTSPQEVVHQYRAMKQELQGLASKLAELEMDKEEHTMVIETLKPVPTSRKCFRLVGGVLMERTVKEVLPALQTNLDGINKLLNQLAQALKSKEEEAQTFFKKNQDILQEGGPESTDNSSKK